MLEKRNKNKNVFYKSGEVISFKVSGKNSRVTGEILNIKDSVIVFRSSEVKVSDVTHLYIDEKTRWWLRYKVEQMALILGGGYLLLDVINTGEINKEVVAVSATLIGVGLIAKILIGNKIKIGGRTKLRVVTL